MGYTAGPAGKRITQRIMRTVALSEIKPARLFQQCAALGKARPISSSLSLSFSMSNGAAVKRIERKPCSGTSSRYSRAIPRYPRPRNFSRLLSKRSAGTAACLLVQSSRKETSVTPRWMTVATVSRINRYSLGGWVGLL